MAATKKYIETFSALWAAKPNSAQEVYNAMMKAYPDRFNTAALRASCLGTFAAMKAGKPQL